MKSNEVGVCITCLQIVTNCIYQFIIPVIVIPFLNSPKTPLSLQLLHAQIFVLGTFDALDVGT